MTCRSAIIECDTHVAQGQHCHSIIDTPGGACTFTRARMRLMTVLCSYTHTHTHTHTHTVHTHIHFVFVCAFVCVYVCVYKHNTVTKHIRACVNVPAPLGRVYNAIAVLPLRDVCITLYYSTAARGVGTML